MSSFKTLDDLPQDLTNQRALVRVDLNLPMAEGRATDLTRARAVAPTILELSQRGAKVLWEKVNGGYRITDFHPEDATPELRLIAGGAR